MNQTEYACGQREQDLIAHEAYGFLMGFARRNECPEYIREMVKQYQLRMAAARAVSHEAKISTEAL